jgi:hypothetical protein
VQAVAAITLASLVGPLGNSSLYASNLSIRPTIDLMMGFLDSTTSLHHYIITAMP